MGANHSFDSYLQLEKETTDTLRNELKDLKCDPESDECGKGGLKQQLIETILKRREHAERKVQKIERIITNREKENERTKRFNDIDKTIAEEKENTDKRFNDIDKTIAKEKENTDKRFNDVDKKIAEEKENTDKKFIAVSEKIATTNLRFNDLDKKMNEQKENTDKRFEDILKQIEDGEKNTSKRLNDLDKKMNEQKENTDKRLTLQNQSRVDADNQIQHRFATYEDNMTRIGNSLVDANKRIESLTKAMLVAICEINYKHYNMENIIEQLAGDNSKCPDTVEEWLDNFDHSFRHATLNDKAISNISKCIDSQGILQVGLMFDLTYSDINQIQADYPTTPRQAYAVLLKWRNKMGRKATIENLLRCLFEAAENVNFEALKKALDTIKASHGD